MLFTKIINRIGKYVNLESRSKTSKTTKNSALYSEVGYENDKIREEFPRLSDVGNTSLGEDAEMCGDTLNEAILDGPVGRSIEFKRQTIQELQKLLSLADEEIDRITQTSALIAINPTADVEEPPNWGRYPSYRAFWEAVLRAFENDRREVTPHHRTAGGYVLRRHVGLTEACIERRFMREKQDVVSFFTSKQDAEQAIHQVLQNNADRIDEWLKTAEEDAKLDVQGNISGCGTVVVQRADRIRREALRAKVTIRKTEYNEMAYHIVTVRLYE